MRMERGIIIKGFCARRCFTIALAASLFLFVSTLKANAQAPQEAEEYNQQAIELYKQGRYQEAFPLAEKALAINEKALGKNHPNVAQSLNGLALLYYSLGDYAKAEPLYTRSLEIREKALGKDHNDVATSLNNLAELYKARGDYSKAEPLYKRSLEITEKALGKDHPDVATSLNNLAELYRVRGEYAKAEPLYKRSLEIKEKAFGKDHPDVALSLNNLAGLYYSLGDYAKAEPLLKRSLEINEKTLGKDHPNFAINLNNLAGLYHKIGDYTRAEPLYKRSIEIQEKALGKNHPSVATCLNFLAVLYYSLGDYAKAEPLLKRSLEINEKALGKDHPDVATILNNLATLYKDRGDYSKAESLYKRALEINEKALGKDHAAVASSLNSLANLYQTFGDYSKAEPLYKRSIEIQEKALGKNHTDVAPSLNNLAWLYKARGDYAKAEPLFNRSLEINEKAFGKAHPDVATCTSNLAFLYLETGRLDEAYRVFKDDTTGMGLGSYYLAKKEYAEAEKQFQKALDIDLNKEIKIPRWIITDHIGLGRSLEGQSRYKEAKEQYRQAIELIESHWRTLNASGRRNFLSGEAGADFKRLDAYDGMVRVLLKEKGAGSDQKALQYAERVKSRLFLEQLAARGAEGSRAQDKAVLAKDRELHQEVAGLRARLTRLGELGNRAPTGELSKVSTAFNKAAARYEEFINQEKMKGGEVASLIDVPAFDAGKLQKMLDADTAVLEYYTAAVCTYAWVITRSSIKTTEIPLGNKQLLEAVNQFRLASIPNKSRRPAPVITIAAGAEQNDTTESQKQKNRQQYAATAEELYKKLILPVEKDIITHKLIIIPHGGLHKLPFCSLSDGKQCLIDKYSITVLPAASVAQYLEQKGSKDKNQFFALSNPATAYAPPLMYAEAEVKAIGKLFKEKQVYERAAATKAAAIDNSVGANILHFACHGEFNDMQPMQSGLLLAPDPKGENDGVLQVHEIFGMNLSGANLVTLSACETALGKIQGGDDLVGLSRGFIYAGTPSLLATLWAVDDRATGELMESFYENWQKKGMSKPEALRQAQQLLRQKPEYSDPFYWAGFEMIGDWR
jgi:CHAT domain-containing protein/Tfp pilus assembly protein PilF